MSGASDDGDPGSSHAASGAAARVVETHISTVFFVGDRAYKLKKPVTLPFLDLATREARERICHREVELNQRLAPDVYLGVADVIDPDGRPCDHLVIMRRMPEERRLSRLVEEQDPAVGDHLDAIAELLASFHAGADRSEQIDRAADPGPLSALWEDNFAVLRTADAGILDAGLVRRAEQLSQEFMAGRRALLLRRVIDGHVCDGHGDLQCDDIFCLDDGPRILDCIEFSDDLRYGDVANDVAFLAMDLERLGAPDLADRFIRSYERAAGVDIPRPILHFFIAYRAQVRAKVSCIRAHQLDSNGPEWAAAADAARSLLALCVRHLELLRVHLVVVGGLPGTGKTTVANRIAEALGAQVVRSDVVRLEMRDALPDAAEGFGVGRYADDVTERVYLEMMMRGANALELGRSVVLDASFARASHRADARRLAAETCSELTEIRCEVDADVARTRILRRIEQGEDASEATPEIADAMRSTAEPWPESNILSTAGSIGDVTDRAMAIVAATSHPYFSDATEHTDITFEPA